MRYPFLIGIVMAIVTGSSLRSPGAASEPLDIDWKDRFLTINAPHLPGAITIHYLEAYCRPGSTDRDWGQTVIPHTSERLVSDNPSVLRLRDVLDDGVVVEHTITAATDEVDFRVRAHNPTGAPSQAHWAQPCMRVDRFTGCSRDDARELVPKYAQQCFIFLENRLTMLPTEPWATSARYVPGQVYCPAGVDRNDVNPRPLSELVPSHGLCGCFSADRSRILAVAWEPYQELFQGVIACIHSDFRLGGLQPGEVKQIRGKLYVVANDVDALLARFRRDFPEQRSESEGERGER